jgi:hypothetical protein
MHLLAPVFLAAQAGPGLPPEPIKALNGADEAVIVGAPAPVSDFGALALQTDPGGRAALAVLPGKAVLLGPGVSRSAEILPGAFKVAWAGPRGTAYILSGGGPWRLTRLGWDGSWSRPLEASVSGQFPLAFGSPVQDEAVIIGQPVEFDPRSGAVLREDRVFLRATAQGLSAPVSSAREGALFDEPFWTTGGAQLCLPEAIGDLTRSTVDRVYTTYDPESGSLTRLPSAPSRAERAAQSWMILELAPVSAQLRAGQEMAEALWLTNSTRPGAPGLFIDTGVTAFGLTQDAVWTLRDGVVWRRPLERVDLIGLRSRQIAQDRARALWHAQDAAAALQSWSRQNGLFFPPAARWASVVRPYTRSDLTLERFTYTFGGGLAPANQNPASVVLGYVQGAYGRMWVALDGSTRWELSRPAQS